MQLDENKKKDQNFFSCQESENLHYPGHGRCLEFFLGLLAGAGLIALSGVNPIEAYSAMVVGAFGSPQAFSNVLVRASPLLLGGVGVALGIRAGVWNIGIEGYMYIGAIGAAIVGITNLPIPPILHITLSILVAVVFAVIWGLGPAYLASIQRCK